MTKPNTIANLFNDALLYDEPYMAHFIYYCLMKKKITLEDKSETLFAINLTLKEMKEFEAMKQRDTLKMRPIKLYAIKRNEHLYDFYFAKTPAEAANLHYKLFGEKVYKVIDAYDKMIDKEIYDLETKKRRSFREMMRETFEVPRYVCSLEEGR